MTVEVNLTENKVTVVDAANNTLQVTTELTPVNISLQAYDSSAVVLAAVSEAKAAASAAALSYDSFDDRYLGPKATAPTLDNDGNSLLTGALYWNTTSNELYVWTGSIWTQAAFTAGGGLSLATLDLNAIAASKAVTAVDVFVYDTSKDSDGGAWRKRTQHTSWYNETLNTATRGSRREFPAVAVVVAESNKVTIYDGDDPALPMWMVFETLNKGIWVTGLTGLVVKNGEVSVSGTGPSYFGWSSVNFVSEVFKFATSSGQRLLSNTVVQRNATASIVSTDAAKAIVNSIANDVAMTVLPDAPIDPATGLPVPTIACLVAETEVLMADGSTKRLDQVQPGEMVKTLEGEHKVLNWWDQGIKDVIELEFDGGHKIICTADHKIRTTTGWVEAGDLTEDHEVVVA